jgi:hypothetical protein
MAKYYAQRCPAPFKPHEVHEEHCGRLPAPADRFYLGRFDHCRDAVRAAKRRYDRATGCEECSPNCLQQ